MYMCAVSNGVSFFTVLLDVYFFIIFLEWWLSWVILLTWVSGCCYSNRFNYMNVIVTKKRSLIPLDEYHAISLQINLNAAVNHDENFMRCGHYIISVRCG